MQMPSEADIFGIGSSRLTGPLQGVSPEAAGKIALTGSLSYEILVLVIFLLFCYIVYHFRGCILLLFTVLVRRKVSAEKLMEEKTQFFRHFSVYCSILIVLLVAGFLVRTADASGVVEGIGPDWMHQLIPWSTWIAVCITGIVVAYKKALLAATGYLVEDTDFFSAHSAMAHLYIMAVSLLATPLFLLLALNEGAVADTLFWILITCGGVLYMIFLVRSCRFFLVRKVSILQWFLYLCTVELFPLSFFVLLGVKYT